MHNDFAVRSSLTPLVRPGGFGPSPRQREWDEAQAAWEAKLRKLAGQVSVEEKPARHVQVAPTILEPAGRVTRLDALLLPRSLPAFVGTEGGDLACFRCFAVIGQAIAARTARRRHPEGDRLVVRCTCGALNLAFRDGAGRGQ